MTSLVTNRQELDGATAIPMTTAVVMTMGALHDGHGQLMREARMRVGTQGRVIVTDFVNPTQFGAGEDFDRYPRTLDADMEVCARNGVDIVFAPAVSEIYGSSESGIYVDPGSRGSILEGKSRPGHFAGVLTVVAKLMHITRPDVALFGEKDYQQLVLIRDMMSALDFRVVVVGVPTVRESDGLAMSSRNRYLSDRARARSATIPLALAAGKAAAHAGADAAVAATRDVLVAEGMDIDYVACTDESLNEPIPGAPGRLLLAVVVDGTRLIDNVPVEVGMTS
jgi:pantoate--beta-alanine ligase